MRVSKLPFLALAYCASLAATPITVNVGIPGDILVVAPYNNANAGWFVEFTGGPAGLSIESVTVTLGGGLVAKTGTCLLSFGCGLNAAIVSGANVGTPGFTGSDVVDGATQFTLNFSDFGPTERFKFLLDLIDVSPLDLNVTAGELFGGGNSVTYAVRLGGPGFATTTLQGALSFTQNLDNSPLPLDFLPVNYARGTITGDVAAVPEPASWSLVAGVLAAAGMLRRRRR